jgi:catechol 2,3-dioxygenase-like lactoylglutathione lyase family enzyme
MRVRALDHIQLAMPPGREAEARAFYADLLGIPEIAKPANLACRGGCWFERGALKIHLGVEAEFRPARKAHPAFLVDDLATLAAALEVAGHPVRADEPLEGYERLYVDDPFGNRIELMQPGAKRFSAAIARESVPDRAMRHAFESDEVAVSEAIIAELLDVFARPRLARFIDPDLRDETACSSRQRFG